MTNVQGSPNDKMTKDQRSLCFRYLDFVILSSFVIFSVRPEFCPHSQAFPCSQYRAISL
jgi:hypothetical protein